MAIKSSDQITVVDLTDGYSVNLTNDSFTFAGDKDGKIATQQSTTTVIQALRGDEEPTISVDNSQITKPSGVTTSWNANTKTLTITVSTSVASGGVVTIPVVLDGSVTINKVFSFAIAKTGATGETGATGRGIHDDALKAAFVTMINKLIFARKLILKPYVQALRKGNNDDSLHRIQELQTLLMENSQQKERLTGFMAQGYIDQILYNEEMNTLLAQADRYNSEIEMLSKSVKGDACHIQAATALLRFTERSSMLDSFDEELFEETVSRVRVLSREKIAFELKCGLTLTERM